MLIYAKHLDERDAFAQASERYWNETLSHVFVTVCITHQPHSRTASTSHQAWMSRTQLSVLKVTRCILLCWSARDLVTHWECCIPCGEFRFRTARTSNDFTHRENRVCSSSCMFAHTEALQDKVTAKSRALRPRRLLFASWSVARMKYRHSCEVKELFCKTVLVERWTFK